LQALTEALTILQDKAQAMDTAANSRAMLQAQARPSLAVPHSFLQETAARSRARGLLVRESMGLAARQGRASEFLRSEGMRLRSPVLSALATKVAADPFAKVKQLIQDLVERLIAESTAEATKKGFCDTELGKANKNLEFRHADKEDQR
jgi:hypothetical protein